MDNRDIDEIRMIKEVMRRTMPENDMPEPDLSRFGPWIAAVIIVAFVIWAIAVSIPAGVLNNVSRA